MDKWHARIAWESDTWQLHGVQQVSCVAYLEVFGLVIDVSFIGLHCPN